MKNLIRRRNKWAYSDVKQGNEGFGYDPIFIPENDIRSFAQMSMQEKGAISHRGRAVKKLVAYLKIYLNLTQSNKLLIS